MDTDLQGLIEEFRRAVRTAFTIFKIYLIADFWGPEVLVFWEV